MLKEITTNRRVLLGMSGGIDSTIAIHYLQNAGFEVVGLTLDIRLNNNTPISNVQKAKHLATKLNIEHHVVNVSEIFKKEVIDYFTGEYLQARTPSPCLICNNKIKFQFLYDYSLKLNCDKIATGHYVNIDTIDGIYYISKGIDKQKDQSYFLWNIGQEILKKCVFPLGNMHKKDILKQAKSMNLHYDIDARESMSVCFLRGNDYRDFLDEQFPDLRQTLKDGKILNEKGEIMGSHTGYPYYTVGQKRGLNLKEGITGQYVAQIDSASNTLITKPKHEITSSCIICTDYYFNDINYLNTPQKVNIRIRGFDYKEPTPGLIKIHENKLQINFETPVWAATPGQAIVFYVGNRVVGGAIV